MKIFAKVSYLGTNYHGWQKQPNANSIQEEIEKVLSKILNKEVNIFASGRTDAGVHAKGQTFHFDVDKKVDLDKLRYSANMLLPNDIHILSFEEKADDFHARFSAKGKYYQYVINVGENNPFTYQTSYHYPYPFDYELLRDSLALFYGKHNFQNFTSKEEDESGFIRTITSVNITQRGNYIYIDLFGDGFMRYMIRDIVGTSLAVASGKEDINFIKEKLDSNNRSIVSYKADSEGLYLIDVIY